MLPMAFDSKIFKQEFTPSHYGDVLLPVGVVGVLLLMLSSPPPVPSGSFSVF